MGNSGQLLSQGLVSALMEICDLGGFLGKENKLNQEIALRSTGANSTEIVGKDPEKVLLEA